MSFCQWACCLTAICFYFSLEPEWQSKFIFLFFFRVLFFIIAFLCIARNLKQNGSMDSEKIQNSIVNYVYNDLDPGWSGLVVNKRRRFTVLRVFFSTNYRNACDNKWISAVQKHTFELCVFFLAFYFHFFLRIFNIWPPCKSFAFYFLLIY